MNHAYALRPALTVNRPFMREFIDAETPCFALSMVEEKSQQTGFLALRPREPIPPIILSNGFSFGHQLLGNDTFEVILFVFKFYGFHNYNVLVNPNNPIVQTVLKTMIENEDYFFFAINPDDNHTTAFRTNIRQEPMKHFKEDLSRIQNSTTTESQYQEALSRFAENPHPEGELLKWVCRDNPEYLDPAKDKLELMSV